MNTQLTFQHVLTPSGLLSDLTLVLDDAGVVVDMIPASGPADGFLALPGMPNAHSHAFQRALAGFGESAGAHDSFWSWREAMYGLANAVTAEDIYAIARMAFAEMLLAGYTSVAEFHYLHHGVSGERGPEMGQAVIQAASDVGILLSLFPVFYQTGDFDQPALVEQHRFVHGDIEAFLRLLGSLGPTVRGIAPHSLRAVPAAQLPELLRATAGLLGKDFPVHIHICEQMREVEDCRRKYGKTPLDLLAGSVSLDHRWQLVHATHVSKSELRKLRTANATVVLCPSTEAYLGDGLFPAAAHVSGGGRIAIGSDSNCRIDVIEELRWLEYGQRLRDRQRSRLAGREGLGIPVWRMAAQGGAASVAQPVGTIAPGYRADIVVLDADQPPWLGHAPESVVDAWLIGGSRDNIAAVYVGGQKLVDHGTVLHQAEITTAFGKTISRLSAHLSGRG